MSETKQESVEEQGLPSIDTSLVAESDNQEGHEEQVEATTITSKKTKLSLIAMLAAALLVIGGGIYGVLHVLNGFNDTDILVSEPDTGARDTPVALDVGSSIASDELAATEVKSETDDSESYEVSVATEQQAILTEFPINTAKTFEVKEPSLSGAAEKNIAVSVQNGADSSLSDVELSKLVDLITTQNELLNQIVNTQKTILGRVNENGKLASEQVEVSQALGTGLQGVVKGNEAIVRMVSKASKSAVSNPERATNKASVSRTSKKAQEEPQFIAKSASLWGEEVKVMIEIKGGFYQNVQLGDEVEGWTLIDIDLKKKQTTWGKGSVEQVLKYS